MISNLLIVGACTLMLVTSSTASGKLGYDEKCSMLAQVGSVFGGNDENSCNTDKNLVCMNENCVCIPGTAYEKNLLESFVGGGSCVGAANSPCLGDEHDKSTRCVKNSECSGEKVGICKCNEGFHSSDGYCSGSSVIQITGYTLFGVIALFMSMSNVFFDRSN